MLVNIFPSWDIKGRELDFPMCGNIHRFQCNIILLNNSKYFVSFSAVRRLQKGILIIWNSEPAQMRDRFCRDVIVEWVHQK